MERNQFIRQTSFVAAGLHTSRFAAAVTGADFPQVRIPAVERRFNSTAMQALISRVQKILAMQHWHAYSATVFPTHWIPPLILP